MYQHWGLFVCAKVVQGWRQNPQNSNEMPDDGDWHELTPCTARRKYSVYLWYGIFSFTYPRVTGSVFCLLSNWLLISRMLPAAARSKSPSAVHQWRLTIPFLESVWAPLLTRPGSSAKSKALYALSTEPFLMLESMNRRYIVLNEHGTYKRTVRSRYKWNEPL